MKTPLEPRFELANDALRLAFDRGTGALVGLTVRDPEWHILDRSELGLSFRLLVPTRPMTDWHAPGRRNNAVLGERQRLTALDVAPDGRRAVLTWDGVTSEHMGPLDIVVTQEIVLGDRDATFTLSVDDRSPYPVENVYAPYLGDVQRPPGAAWLGAFSRNGYARAGDWHLWPTYDFLVGGSFGVDHPTQLNPWTPAAGAPMSPFILLRGPGQGLYVGVNGPDSDLVAWHTELRPGFGDSMRQRVPLPDDIDGRTVSTRFAAIHVPHIAPGERRTLTPVTIEPYVGDWHGGADVARRRRQTWMTPSLPPAWARGPHSWQQIHLNSPEDELRVPYRDLVALGEECARYGVTAIQVTGWNDGGQDQGNPVHDPDPRLGGAEELRAAIRAIQAMGVKVVLFTKFTWADQATRRYREDLIRCAIKDPYGDPYPFGGYNYQTATALLDINPKRLISMCFLAEGYLAVAEEEFAKVLAFEPDGILFDESQHHMPALQCFDTSHGHRYGALVYANDRELIHRFRRRAAAAGRTELLIAGEDCYDWEFEVYDLSYLRSEDPDHLPLTRHLLPTVNVMTALNGFDDREMVNQCLLYRYVMSYEPFNFKGRLSDFPRTVAYGQAMEALRLEMRDRLWDAECRHTVGARVTVDGAAHHPYSVFHREDGACTVVIANDDPSVSITASVSLEGGGVPVRYRLVDHAAWRAAADGVMVPPRSAAIVLDSDAT